MGSRVVCAMSHSVSEDMLRGCLLWPSSRWWGGCLEFYNREVSVCPDSCASVGEVKCPWKRKRTKEAERSRGIGFASFGRKLSTTALWELGVDKVIRSEPMTLTVLVIQTRRVPFQMTLALVGPIHSFYS